MPADDEATVFLGGPRDAQQFHTGSKTRIARLHTLLTQAGHQLDAAEVATRTAGASTAAALRAATGGRADDAAVQQLRADALRAKLSSKTQQAGAQRALRRALGIAKVDLRIDEAELRSREFGTSTRAAVAAFQRRYGLPETGEFDPATWERMASVNASRPQPARTITVDSAQALVPLRKQLRLNMTGAKVAQAQQTLAYLGLPIAAAEHGAQRFGATTRAAVLAFQQRRNLPATGHLDTATVKALNAAVGLPVQHSHRLRGSVRDETWQGVGGVTVQVRHRPLRGEGELLAERRTLANGFYDLPYPLPVDPATGQPRNPVHLHVTFLRDGQPIGSRVVFNPTLTTWVNLTLGPEAYRSTSLFAAWSQALARAAAGVPVADLVEDADTHEVTRAAMDAGLDQDAVMRVLLAHRVSAALADPVLTAEACFAFLAQNLPQTLPDDLLAATQEWTRLDELVEQTATGLAFLDPTSVNAALDTAAARNLASVSVTGRRADIADRLAAHRTTFALDKPILIGDGTLRSVLASSGIAAGSYATVADAFVTHGGPVAGFWTDLDARAAELGGTAAVADLRTTVDAAHIAANSTPVLQAIKNMIADPGLATVATTRDLAKLTETQWRQVLADAGDPAGITAADLATRSEQMYPDVALAAHVGRATGHGITHIGDVARFIDDRPDFTLLDGNVDSYVAAHARGADADVVTQLRVLQRARRLAPDAAAGTALLTAGLHSSVQIVALGHDGLAARLTGVPAPTVARLYANAETQYAQILQRIGSLRFELQAANPMVLSPQNLTVEDVEKVLGEIPNLEVLFGSLDYCDCAGCLSVYSPAAYLADMLRFLDNRPALAPGDTVLDVLKQRRADLVDITLNCANTETPLPYIDLVCEALEGAVPATVAPPTGLQTTRTAAELRAFPEHVRVEAYQTLRDADFLSAGFDLWLEEARLLLDHLGMPRHELMAAFGGVNPTTASVAGEFFGLSPHATTQVTTADATVANLQEVWGLDPTRTQLSVAEFMQHSRLTYDQVRELLDVEWPVPAPADPLVLLRPGGTCDLDEQQLTGFTPALFDRLHRFLRLWRATDWRLHEVDLLLRAEGVGAGTLTAATLPALQQFTQVARRLKVPFAGALALYRPILTTPAPDPDAVSQYDSMFANKLLTSPVDPAFALPLPGTEPLAAHHATLAAAYQVTEAELITLLARTGPLLTLANLTTALRHVTLARGLRIPIADLFTLIDLSAAAVPDPYANPAATLELISRHEEITRAGFTVAELDFLLNVRPDAPYDLREQVITEQVTALRESLRATPAADKDGPITAYVAGTFGLAEAQAAVLLDRLALYPVLADPALVAQDSGGEFTTAVTATTFPAIYRTWRRLNKTALLVRRLRMRTEVLAWLLDNATAFGWLHPADLPVDTVPGTPLLGRWRELAQWLHLYTRYPEPEGVTLTGVYDLARSGAALTDVRAELAALTGIDADDLTILDAAAATSYTAPSKLARMLSTLALTRRLGIDAATGRAWARRDEPGQDDTTREIAQTVRAKYDEPVWLARITPLQDALRERKRAALVDHLLEHSARTVSPTVTAGGKQYANPAYWRRPEDMLRYFLLDVEMSSCQLTSRIKQALGSVQMFVQRCQLNLERPYVAVSAADSADTTSLDSWRQWRWMKNYRIWEANRKVFLYPENWIEPELRDDKSPFFRELEDDIMSQDVTDATAEDAFRRYLQKVHEVARLTVVGVYHDDNTMHVVARTAADPARYFYRTFDLSYGVWTCWEKIDLDITGDHVIPVVYNRRLHLFWLVFAEKPQKVRKQPPAEASAAPQDVPDGPKQLEIQLAWSVRTPDGFSARRTSPYLLIHPWQRPTTAYHLKPRYKPRENQLWLDIYLSTTQEFNNTQFYDPYADKRAYVTATRFDETARPWHSSSFVYDGEIVALKLKPLRGQYRILLPAGHMSETPIITTSHQYVHDSFGKDGKAVAALTGPYEIAPRLVLPDGMHFENTRLANNRRNPNPGTVRVIAGGTSTTLATGARAPFELAMSPDIQYDVHTALSPMIYQDRTRSFFIRPQWRAILIGTGGAKKYYSTGLKWLNVMSYTWYPFYHPYTALFLRELDRSGVDGLVNRRMQRTPGSYPPSTPYSFSSYAPAGWNSADTTAQNDVVDFSRYGSHAKYNWETFFDGPLLLAGKLSANQRFEEAMRWYHRIFDPTNTDDLPAPQRYWITKPFFEHTADDYRKQRIEQLLADITGDNLEQVRAWKNNPFNPHLIARHRPVAFQRTVVMKYLDNLIAWGDQLFRRDTLESINEATQLYVLAAELLGPRPVKVPPVPHAEKSYAELVADGALDPFGNKKIEVLMENFVSPPADTEPGGDAPALPHIEVQYFGIPANDRLLAYWDTVADRLFKVRNCMNIEGTIRRLPLFEPPIDPALLVKAAAAGVDLSSVLALSTPPAGLYRFRILADKAATLCAEVRALGERLLQALERRDAEALALLHSGHEVIMREAVRTVREQQVDEALKSQAALEAGIGAIQQRIDYYGDIPRMNSWEVASTVSHSLGLVADIVATVLNSVAGATAVIPQVKAGASGFGGTPALHVEIGGEQASKSSFNFAAMFAGLAGIAHRAGEMLATQGNLTRQDDANRFSKRLAERELTQLQVQIEAAQIRHAMAESELANQEIGIAQSQAVDEVLRAKYTNRQLFDWMAGQVSTVYFQAYQLAFDLARRAEQAYRLELAEPSASYIQFGYWDSLKKGLLAGDRLNNDLRRMEAAYLERHTREFEITKHVSLAEIDPLALLRLKLTGATDIAVPEWLFDLDYPGHYRRRLKSVALSIPCVVGPYTSVNCTLSLTNNGVRLTDSATGGYGDPLTGGDDRFQRNPVPVAAIATSHGTADRGMFELRFADERYLPFEYAGAVSQWHIDLPKANNRFDFATISDVVLHLDYTAVPGSTVLADAARDNLDTVLPTSGRILLTLDEQFGTAWHRMLHPAEGDPQTMTFTLTADHLPFWAKARIAAGAGVSVTALDVILDTPESTPFTGQLARPGVGFVDVAGPVDTLLGGAPHLAQTPPPGAALLGQWGLRLRKSSATDFTALTDSDIGKAYLLVAFKAA